MATTNIARLWGRRDLAKELDQFNDAASYPLECSHHANAVKRPFIEDYRDSHIEVHVHLRVSRPDLGEAQSTDLCASFRASRVEPDSLGSETRPNTARDIGEKVDGAVLVNVGQVSEPP